MNLAGDWRYVYASVPGVAHLSAATECQDACSARLLSSVSSPEHGPLLLLAAADGAGSAARARAGAECACQTLLDAFVFHVVGTPPADWHPASAATLLESVRTALEQQASTAQLALRDFACTLLGAVVAAEHAFFLQIGDGAIVIGAEDRYQPVFWPQTGQYANETRFVTDPDAGARLQSVILAEPVAEIALLTDGLQPLALDYRHRQAHVPFFRPLFQQLRGVPEAGCPEAPAAALERFLGGPAVNQRTHDDKTLMLATRLDAPAAAGDMAQTGAIELPPPSSATETAASPPATAELAEPAPAPDAESPQPWPRDADGAEVL
ncbi:MAG: protein phosphatase 2C domain-containing protein [Candidatus Competibacteraceae bacterium]|nr:protein phosphatase 2C domain-containing protein [Candidatus Competibacteraceae bacterium]